VEVRLHGAQRPVGRLGDLEQRALREEPERHDLAIRLVERGDGGAHAGVLLGAEHAVGRVDGVGHPAGPEPGLARLVRLGSERVEPRDLLAPAGVADGEADRDPGQPRPERTVGAPAR